MQSSGKFTLYIERKGVYMSSFIRIYNSTFFVLGAMESDYPVEEEILKADSSSPQRKPPSSPGGSGSNNSDSGIGGITFVQCATGTASRTTSKSSSPADSPALRGKAG